MNDRLQAGVGTEVAEIRLELDERTVHISAEVHRQFVCLETGLLMKLEKAERH